MTTWLVLMSVWLAGRFAVTLSIEIALLATAAIICAFLVRWPLRWDAVRVMVRLLTHASALPGAPPIVWRNHRRLAKKRPRHPIQPRQATEGKAVLGPDRRHQSHRDRARVRRSAPARLKARPGAPRSRTICP
jgi:hypothetical protein